MLKLTAEQAMSSGYCITSRAHLMASRIDREDWKTHMSLKRLPSDPGWADRIGRHAGDHYRRCYSKDTITVPAGWLKKLPNSGDGPNEFIPKLKGNQ